MKKLAIILFLLSFLELLIFGARGAMFSVVIFCVLYLFFVSKLKMKVIFSFLIFVIYFGLKYVLTFIIKFLAKYKIESYAITKYLNVLNGNSFSSTTSGRDIIYETSYQGQFYRIKTKNKERIFFSSLVLHLMKRITYIISTK